MKLKINCILTACVLYVKLVHIRKPYVILLEYMGMKPSYVIAEEIGLTEAIHKTCSTPIAKILERKLSAAKRACEKFHTADLCLVYGSVAVEDIVGFFSDIDMLFIGDFEEKRNNLVKVMDEPVIATFHTIESFENFLMREVRYYGYDERSSLYYCLSTARALKNKGILDDYLHIVDSEISTFFNQYSGEDFLDEFFWQYGGGLESNARGDINTGFVKIQEAAKLLLRYWLSETYTLLRKPLPDNRGFLYLKDIEAPEMLITFLREAFERKGGVFATAREAFKEIAGDYKWYGSIVL